MGGALRQAWISACMFGLRSHPSLLVRVGGNLGGVRMRGLSIRVLLVLGLCLAACGGSDASDQIHGTWYWADYGAYETFESDGTWTAQMSLDEEPFDWGTYTLEDGVLTSTNADDSYCPGGSAVWEVAFSEDGDELRETTVSESCTNFSVRGQDRVLARHTP